MQKKESVVLMVEELWGSLAKSGFIRSNQKEQDSGKLHGVLSKKCIRRRPWEVERLLSTRAAGKPYWGLSFTSESASDYLEHVLT